MQTQPDDITTRELIALGYLETEGCAGTGTSPCSFAWTTTNNTPFAVITEGQRVRRLLCD